MTQEQLELLQDYVIKEVAYQNEVRFPGEVDYEYFKRIARNDALIALENSFSEDQK